MFDIVSLDILSRLNDLNDEEMDMEVNWCCLIEAM